jgi:DNA-binding transcriptional LysR family regulator
VRLLDRAGGRIVPTAAGAALLEPARRAQAAIEDAVAAVAAYRTGETGRVRFGSGATACIYLLPSVLADAKRRMPGLEAIVATGNTGDIVRRIESGALDVGLATMPVPVSRALQVEPLLTDRLLALLPVGMAADEGALDAAALAALPLILYEPGGTTRALIDGWFRQAGVNVAPIMQLDSVETIKVLVGGGLGASILPELALRAAVPDTVVRSLRPDLSRRLAIVVRREKVVDRGLRVMLEALRALAN